MFQNQGEIIIKLAESSLSDYSGKSVVVNSGKYLGGGCINHVQKLETNIGQFLIKYNSEGNADVFMREAEGLDELRKASGGQILIPEVIVVKEINETPGFLILEYLEQISSTVDSELKLGFALAQIHKFQSAQFGFRTNNYCGTTIQNNQPKTRWIEFYRDNRIGWIIKEIEKRRHFSTEEKLKFEKLMDRLPGLMTVNEEPVLIHGDLWSGNFLISTRGPALIDPAVSYSIPEMEFGMITLFGGFSSRFFDAYNEVNPLPGDWKARTPLYQLYHILNHYLLFGGGYLNRAMQIIDSFL